MTALNGKMTVFMLEIARSFHKLVSKQMTRQIGTFASAMEKKTPSGHRRHVPSRQFTSTSQKTSPDEEHTTTKQNHVMNAIPRFREHAADVVAISCSVKKRPNRCLSRQFETIISPLTTKRLELLTQSGQ
jgi:hypothetical protein